MSNFSRLMPKMMVFLAIFITFTLAYTTLTSAIIWNQECQGDNLIRTWNGTINGERVTAERDPINCRFGCTNLSQPPKCIIAPETEVFSAPFMPMPIYILLEVMAMVFLIGGIVARSEDGESYLVLPLLSFILFLFLSISSVSIDNIFNSPMMWLNMGLGLFAFIYVMYSYFKGPTTELAENAMNAV